MNDKETEHIFASTLNITGKVWERSSAQFKSTSWLHPIDKFTRWLDAMRCGTAFVNAIDVYQECLTQRE